MEKLYRILEDINSDIDYKTENALVDDGLFDSLEILTLVSEISTKYRVDIDPDDITAENFNSADAIYAMIQKYL